MDDFFESVVLFCAGAVLVEVALLGCADLVVFEGVEAGGATVSSLGAESPGLEGEGEVLFLTATAAMEVLFCGTVGLPAFCVVSPVTLVGRMDLLALVPVAVSK